MLPLTGDPASVNTTDGNADVVEDHTEGDADIHGNTDAGDEAAGSDAADDAGPPGMNLDHDDSKYLLVVSINLSIKIILTGI